MNKKLVLSAIVAIGCSFAVQAEEAGMAEAEMKGTPKTEAVEAGMAESEMEGTPKTEAAEAPSQEKMSAPIQAGEVARAQLTSGIEKREPVDALTSPINVSGPDIYKLYYFTDLRKYAGKTVTHRWSKGDEVMAEVKFKVGGDRWRVHSSKNFNPYMTGKWTVAVVVDGEVVKSDNFDLNWTVAAAAE